MKEILVLLGLALCICTCANGATLRQQLDPRCPPINPPDDVLLPAEDCQHFYKCNHGVPVLIPCPPGQEWADHLKRCDWPEVAQCSIEFADPEPIVSDLSNACPAVNPPEDVLLPAADCQHFYKCNHGTPVLFPCPAGQEWAQHLRRCDWPEVAQCSVTGEVQPSTSRPIVSTPPKPVNPSTPARPVPTSCPAENGDEDVLLPAEDCQHFYKCNHGVPVLQECPKGLDWSQSLLRCDWPEVAQCSGTGEVRPSTSRPIVSTPPKPVNPSTPARPVPTNCPAENGVEDVLLPAEDCQHFYKCDHGVPVIQECPEGLDWSQGLLRCDWPEVAQCSGTGVIRPSTSRPIVSTPPKPVEPSTPARPVPTSCPAENGEEDVLLPAEDCQHFYKCDHGVPVIQECPEGLDWSQGLLRCDWPEVAQCSGTGVVRPSTSRPIVSTPPKPVEPSTPERPVSTSCPAENGEEDVLLPAEDCQHFYKCDHGVPVLQECPEGLDWSQGLLRCDWPEVAQCSGTGVIRPSTSRPIVSTPPKPVNPSTPTRPVPTSCPAENGDKDVLLPAKDCQHFYKCDHGVPVLQECPAGLEWSQGLLRCDWPEVAQCSGTGVVRPSTSRPIVSTPPKPVEPSTPVRPVPTSCPAENGEEDVLLPAEDCQHFYKCDHGVPVLQECPEGLDWSQGLLRCDWPEVAQCSGTGVVRPSTPRPIVSTPPKPVEPSTPARPVPTSCPAENGEEDVLLPAEDCQHFYKCDHGVPVLQECPEGLDWSHGLLRCDWPEVAQCSGTGVVRPSTSRPIVSTPPKPVEPSTPARPVPTSCPAENGEEDVLLPAEDCQHFYKCDHGVPVIQECPEGLDWSQGLLRCDWPEVAQCSGTGVVRPSTSRPIVSTPPKPVEQPSTPARPVPTSCPAENGEEDVLLPAEDCQHFYKCDHGVPVIQECPEGLDWSQDLLRCDWPEVAQCSGTGVVRPSTSRPIVSTPPKPVEPSTPARPVPTSCPAENGEQDVLLPAEDCQHFYKCDHGVPVIQECPEGLDWSQGLLRCDLPEVAQCSGTGVVRPSTSRPIVSTPPKPVEPSTPVRPVPTSCPAENGEQDVLLPAEDCQHFYKCDHGVPVIQECPEGLDWSQGLLRCDWPEVAQCSGTGVVRPSTSRPIVSTPPKPVEPSTPARPVPTSCPAENGEEDVLLPAEDCQHFYKCDHGVPVIQECPEGLDWSQGLLRCDWPEVAQCSGTGVVRPSTSRPIVSTPPKPDNPSTPARPVPTSCPAENGEEDALLPAEDCQHFYKCNHGVPVLQECPEGLDWSQSLHRCEWPEVAQCVAY